MRDWLKPLSDIDRDCVHHYEFLLGRQLTGFEEYHAIDSQVNEMVLEWGSRKEFFEAYPGLEKYRKPAKRSKGPTITSKNAKRDRFIRVAEARTQKVLEDIRSLSKCAGRGNYEYESSDVATIFDAIEKELQTAKDIFAGAKKFSLSSVEPDTHHVDEPMQISEAEIQAMSNRAESVLKTNDKTAFASLGSQIKIAAFRSAVSSDSFANKGKER